MDAEATAKHQRSEAYKAMIEKVDQANALLEEAKQIADSNEFTYVSMNVYEALVYLRDCTG